MVHGADEEADPSQCKHDWGNWSVKSKATVFAPLVQKRTCRICKTTQTRTVGKKLKPTWKLTEPSLTMQKKQKTSQFRIYGLANGDSVKAWKSGNTKIVTVTGKPDGTCTLKAGKKKTGKAQITATLASGAKVTFSVKVQKKKVKTKTLTLATPGTLYLKKGKRITIFYSRTPVTVQDKVTFTSKNKKIVSVNKKGELRARKVGKTTITVKSGKKKKKITCIVTE